MHASKIIMAALIGGGTLVSGNCNVLGCIAGMETAGIVAAGTCAAAEVTLFGFLPAGIACFVAIAADVGTIVGACGSCLVAGKCDPTDETANNHGCVSQTSLFPFSLLFLVFLMPTSSNKLMSK